MNNIKAVIFDVDGTILDTQPYILGIIKKLLLRYNLDFKENEYSKVIGKTIYEIGDFLASKMVGESRDSAIELYNEYFYNALEEAGENLQKSGLNELIAYLKEKGVAMAIATSSKMQSFTKKATCAKLDLSNYKIIATLNDVKNGKPDKEIYEYVCKSLNLKPCECIAIEDSYVGLQSAHSCGVVTFRVQDVQKQDESKNNLVDFDFNNLSEILDFLKSCEWF